MAIHTSSRRRLVEQYQASCDRLLERMARRACDFFMAALQGEVRLAVIEERWSPLIAVMAFSAIVCPRIELIGMWILMAIAAIDGCFGKLHVRHGKFHVRWFMAIDARHRPVRSHKWERCLRMVELRKIFPLASGVARRATERLPRPVVQCHTLLKLAFVYILVAGCAT